MPAFLDITIDEPQLSSLTTLIHCITLAAYSTPRARHDTTRPSVKQPLARSFHAHAADAQTRASHVLSATFLDALRHAADTLDRLLPLPQDPALRHPLATRALCLCRGGDVKIRKSGGAKSSRRCVEAAQRGRRVEAGSRLLGSRRRRIEVYASLRGDRRA
ncbi:hypothetical protein DFH09DRAFT_1375617 [Mycena vulgaris]|nr:hypothetical protein DFH09DRAFT_1375617 [Mycena vulgaris]